jgi:hypothetical protein
MYQGVNAGEPSTDCRARQSLPENRITDFA